MGAEIRPKGAREVAQKAAREPDRAEAHSWSLRIEGYGGAGPAVTDDRSMSERRARGWLDVECNRCKT
jgi:hypothetical protein